MAKSEIMNTVTRSLYRVGFKLKKHSPEILVGAGIVGVVGSTIMACKATTKLDEVLEEPKEKIEKIHELMENPDMVPEGKEYTEEDGRKDLTIMYTQSALKVAKLYAPAVILGSVSVAAILGGHHILRKRNFALAAAYATLDKGFKDYRGRVVERFGEELDKELKYNLKEKEIEETIVNEDGTVTTEKKTAKVMSIEDYSKHAKFFDESCVGWTKDPEYNLMFVRDQEKYANILLKTKGHLFVNEVYDLLGIQRTKAGQVEGWIYDDKCPADEKQVDFGIYNIYSEANRNFVNGYEKTILLDFNVDGNILDMM